MEDDGDVGDTDEWVLGDAVEQVLEVAALPPEAAPVLVECLAAVGGSYPDGWLVLWWMPIDIDVDGIVFTGTRSRRQRVGTASTSPTATAF